MRHYDIQPVDRAALENRNQRFASDSAHTCRLTERGSLKE
jgi:hypothetical protein